MAHPTLSRVVLLLRENYADRKAIDPQKMLVQALHVMSTAYEDIQVFERSGCVESITAFGATIRASGVTELWEMTMTLREVFRAATATLPPDEHAFVEVLATSGVLAALGGGDRLIGGPGAEHAFAALHALSELVAGNLPGPRSQVILSEPFAREACNDTGIATLTLSQMTTLSLGPLREALVEVEADASCAGIILDLRGNSGGLLDDVVAAADLFLDAGLIVELRKAQGSTSHTARSTTTVSRKRLVVIVDDTTASGGEMLAGALQSNGRARLIGERTAGAGAVHSLYDFSNGSSLKLLTATAHVSGGAAIHRVGLQPDVTVGHDEVMGRAFAELSRAN